MCSVPQSRRSNCVNYIPRSRYRATCALPIECTAERSIEAASFWAIGTSPWSRFVDASPSFLRFDCLPPSVPSKIVPVQSIFRLGEWFPSPVPVKDSSRRQLTIPTPTVHQSRGPDRHGFRDVCTTELDKKRRKSLLFSSSSGFGPTVSCLGSIYLSPKVCTDGRALP